VNISQLKLRSEKFNDDDDDHHHLVLLTLQMKALFIYETSGTTHPATQCHIPEDMEASAGLLTSVSSFVKDVSVTDSLKLPSSRMWDRTL
jgi:hypothetical protein